MTPNRQKERNNTNHMPENDKRRVLDRESLVYRQPRAKPSDIPSVSQLSLNSNSICTQRHSVASTTVTPSCFQGFRFLCRYDRRSLVSPWVDSTNATLQTPKACYSHPRCNLNLVRLFRFSACNKSYQYYSEIQQTKLKTVENKLSLITRILCQRHQLDADNFPMLPGRWTW